MCLLILFGCSDNNIVEYHQGGEKKMEGKEVGGIKVGTWVYYHSNGDTSKVEYYNEGSLSTVLTYFEGSLYTREQFKDSLKHGESLRYYSNGKIECESFNENGELEGLSTCYYPNGKVKTVIKFSKGEYQGEFKQYYSNGNLFTYSKNVGNGIHEVYDSLGTLNYRILYKDFQPVDTLSLPNQKVAEI